MTSSIWSKINQDNKFELGERVITPGGGEGLVRAATSKTTHLGPRSLTWTYWVLNLTSWRGYEYAEWELTARKPPADYVSPHYFQD